MSEVRIQQTVEKRDVTLSDWSVRQDSDGNCYLVGFDLARRNGGVSTPLVNLDIHAQVGSSIDGRRYVLQGRPGLNVDAEYSWAIATLSWSISSWHDVTASVIVNSRIPDFGVHLYDNAEISMHHPLKPSVFDLSSGVDGAVLPKVVLRARAFALGWGVTGRQLRLVSEVRARRVLVGKSDDEISVESSLQALRDAIQARVDNGSGIDAVAPIPSEFRVWVSQHPDGCNEVGCPVARLRFYAQSGIAISSLQARDLDFSSFPPFTYARHDGVWEVVLRALSARQYTVLRLSRWTEQHQSDLCRAAR